MRRDGSDVKEKERHTYSPQAAIKLVQVVTEEELFLLMNSSASLILKSRYCFFTNSA